MLRVPTFECQIWIDDLAVRYPAVSESVLDKIATELNQLASEFDWAKIHASESSPGEERQYLLAQVGQDGPALYLVSDGAGVSSAPHEHKTWAVIAGIRGIENNIFYEVTSTESRDLCRHRSRHIGAGDYIALTESVVHATEVVGPGATFHLHLYGRPLHSLPPFQERVFRE